MEPGGWHTTRSFLCNVIADNFCFSKVGRNGGLRLVTRFIEKIAKHRLSWIFKKLVGDVTGGGMDWIDLAQDRDRWHACVKAIMTSLVP